MVAKSSDQTVSTTFQVAPMNSTMTPASQKKFLLWVDAVGGFLVCQGESVSIGQAIPTAGVDIPVQADISRRHAKIHRDGEDYLLAPSQATRIDGGILQQPAMLRNGCTVQMGDNVRLKFRQPHPLSATAHLSLLSHHRTQPAVDGIILMADTIILGPAKGSHVVARDWTRQVMLFRRGDQLVCRTDGEFQVNGKVYENEAVVGAGAHIEGKDFSMTLETV